MEHGLIVVIPLLRLDERGRGGAIHSSSTPHYT